MAIVWSILVSLGLVLLSGGLCYGFFRLPPLQQRFSPSQALSGATLVGFWSGYALMYQQWLPGFPPADVSLWWVYSLPILAVVAYWPRGWFSGLLSVLLSGVYAYLLTGPLRQYEWSMVQALGFALAVSVLMGLVPLGVHRVMRVSLWPWVMAITSVGSAALFLLSSSASLAQQALFLMVIQVLWLGRAKRNGPEIKGLVLISVWLLLMLWLNMLVFASLSYPALVGLLALFSPLLLQIKPVARSPFFVQCLTVTLGSGLCLSLAAACVFWFQPQAGLYY